ncbi:transcriptional regulator, partial [Staphylococcus aureus]|nr:transcriptional regulator [Staphylococcus aureus]
MDASTSALQMCPFLHEKNITVVTNSIHVALQFSDSGTVDVLLVGGLLRKSSLSLGGVRDQGLLQYVNIDK